MINWNTQIVALAKVEIARVPTGTWRHDLGERPKLREVKVPVALIWLNEAESADIERARTYAAGNGYEVFVFPPNETDPLGRARREVLASRPVDAPLSNRRGSLKNS